MLRLSLLLSFAVTIPLSILEAATCSWPESNGELDLCPLMAANIKCSYTHSSDEYDLTLTPFNNGYNCGGTNAMLSQDTTSKCLYLALADDTVKPVVYNGLLNPTKVEAYQFLYESGEASGGCFNGRAGDIIFLCNKDTVGNYSVVGCEEEASCEYDIVVETPYACAGDSPTTTTTTTAPETGLSVFLLYSDATACQSAYGSISVSGTCSKSNDLNTCQDNHSFVISSSLAFPISSEMCLISGFGPVMQLGVEYFTLSSFYFEDQQSANKSMAYAVPSPGVLLRSEQPLQFEASVDGTVTAPMLSLPFVQGLQSSTIQLSS